MARDILPSSFEATDSSCAAVADVLNDPARLAALDSTGLLDSPAEEVFDHLTRATQEVLRVPIALVTLITSDRQFFKSAVGLSEPWASLRQTPLSHSFCQIVAAGADTLAIQDAREDERVQDNPAVRELGVVAYLGAPLTVGKEEQHTIGAVCAVDIQPRAWSEKDVQALLDLRSLAVAEIERRGGSGSGDRAAVSEGDQGKKTRFIGDMAEWLARRRKERGLSLGALAIKSGVNKSSLSRWESGVRRRPHAAELDAVLKALGVGISERIEVHSALGNAHEARLLWEQAWREGKLGNGGDKDASAAAPTLPMPGDVLREMRRRMGWSQTQLADHLGARQGSIAKWEASDDWPDMERTLALCVALCASSREADLLLGWCAARSQGWRISGSPT